jgi:hypothetical protein
MRRKIYEFIVKATVSGESGHLNVIGRCGDIPIQLGDKFDVIYDYKPHKFPEESGRPPVRCHEKPVSLHVVCIHAYQHSLPELGEGMTGSLAIEGDGADQVMPGWILGLRDCAISSAPLVTSPADRSELEE